VDEFKGLHEPTPEAVESYKQAIAHYEAIKKRKPLKGFRLWVYLITGF